MLYFLYRFVLLHKKEPNGGIAPCNLFLNVLLVILVIAVIALAVLYFWEGLEKRQVEQQQLLEMSKQTVSMLVIDKKENEDQGFRSSKNRLRADSKYMRWAKVPVVKAKVGPKVMTLLADERVFASLRLRPRQSSRKRSLHYRDQKRPRRSDPAGTKEEKGFFARF